LTDVEGYREYVSTRLEPWRRAAYLLCGDWHTADDLVSTALIRLLRHWRRAAEMDNLDGYVRRIIVRAWLDERRRPWRRERSQAELPEPAQPVATPGDRLDDRSVLLAYLAELPPRRRAVIVLRYFCDLSVEATADALGCSTGTVKSQTARALDALRARFGAVGDPEEVLWNR
jgi:RNA polymerase sigma-70 factor (sigma-E family)